MVRHLLYPNGRRYDYTFRCNIDDVAHIIKVRTDSFIYLPLKPASYCTDAREWDDDNSMMYLVSKCPQAMYASVCVFMYMCVPLFSGNDCIC